MDNKRVARILRKLADILDSPKKPKKSSSNQSSVSKIREQFLACYKKTYGRDYPGWGAKENKQAENWLKSCPLEKALVLCRFWPEWKDVHATKAAHPFGMLVSRWIALDAWVQDANAQSYRIACAKVAEKLAIAKAEEIFSVRTYAEQAKRNNQISDEYRGQIQDSTSSTIPWKRD
jgi:hypothetical protein